MASPASPQQPAPGSSFYPQNHELLTQYLLPKLAGSALPAATQHFFVDTDVYADDPGTLTLLHQPGPARTFGESENWYFFCTEKPNIARDGRKPRIVGGGKGTWKSERGEMVVDPVEGHTVGRLERFTYKPKPKLVGKKPEWLMVEFSLDEQEVDGEPRIVLCKIYRSPRFLRSASKASSSASACKSKTSVRKRKASGLDSSPASLSASARKITNTTGASPVRRQLLFPDAPALNPLADQAVLGENSDPFRQQLQLPNPLAVLGDDQPWSEFSAPTQNPSPPVPNSPVKEDFLGDKSDSMMQQLQVPSPPAPNSPVKEDFLGDNSSSMMHLLRSPSPPAPTSPINDFFGDNSNSMMHLLRPPSPPGPTSPIKEDFFGDNSNSMLHLLRPPSPPAPNLTADVDEWMVQFLADGMAPWPCSITAAPVPFRSGMDFCNSIAAP